VRAALRAEWTKMRTVTDTVLGLLATVVLTVAVSAVAAAAVTGPVDPVHVSLLGVQIGQGVVAIAAVQAVGGEFGTGMIRTTFLALPRRLEVLAAKAVLLVAGVLAAGSAAVLGCAVTGHLLLPAPVGGGALLRAAIGSVAYLVLIALLALGAGAAVRNATAAAGVVLSLLYLTPVAMRLFPDPDWQVRIYRVFPATAGLSVQTTVGAADLPIGPWAGLAVTAAWSAAALAAGAVRLRFRDA
jgi:ABC-2 type transport system permease protein